MTNAVHKVFAVAIVVIFFLVDKHLPQLPQVVRFGIFFPVALLRMIAEKLSFPEDYKVLLILLLGIPVLVLYWFTVLTILLGKQRRNKPTV